ncbi:MAG: phospholipase D family protein [Pseudomonadota bacterium]|nr:phospholipase D family protein [Pseudomonadota bacterium]
MPARQIRIDSAVIVAFSPNGDATRVIVSEINHAQHQILVQAYSFTSKPIISALARAKDRGVDVEVIADKSNEHERYSGIMTMREHHVPVWIDNTVDIAHNKVMIFDDQAVLTGSFNFSVSAQKYNAENILLIKDDPALANLYIKNWDWRKSLSQQIQ